MSDLPVRGMVLYKHGVGFFHREGQIDAEEVSLSFRQDEINDVLKSLAAYDPVDVKTVKRFQLTGPQLHPDIMSDLAGYTLATVRSRG